MYLYVRVLEGAMSEMQSTVIYKTVNRHALKADFYGTGHSGSPVIMFLHGGGLIWGSRKDIFEDHIYRYNEAGFSVFSIDYRLAPETKLPQILTDVRDALSWLKSNGEQQFDIDASKVAVVGSSAGGYLSLMTGTLETPEKPKAIVSFYGYGDIGGQWYTTPSQFYCQQPIVTREQAIRVVSNHTVSEGTMDERFAFYLYCRQTGRWVQEVSGYEPSVDHKEVERLSPVFQVRHSFPPTMLLHGDKDNDVPYEQSLDMAEALAKHGVSHQLITIQNGGHVFDRNLSNPVVNQAFDDVIHFLHKHLES